MRCKTKYKDWSADNGVRFKVDKFTESNTISLQVTKGAGSSYRIDDTFVMFQDPVLTVNLYGVTRISYELINNSGLNYNFIIGPNYIEETVPPNGMATGTITIDGSDKTLELTITNNISTSHTTIKDDESYLPLELKDIVDSDLITDDISTFFNDYYANWFIVDPNDDFAYELRLTFLENEEKLRQYKSELTNFNPKPNTTMTVQYGERNVTEKGYDYPVDGEVATSSPSTGNTSKQDTVNDTTTVTKDDDPFKTLNRTRDMVTFNKFFVDCFKDCFTLHSGMVW